jgi:hypothetical protein
LGTSEQPREGGDWPQSVRSISNWGGGAWSPPVHALLRGRTGGNSATDRRAQGRGGATARTGRSKPEVMAGCFYWTNKPAEILRVHSISIPTHLPLAPSYRRQAVQRLIFSMAPAAVSAGACSSTPQGARGASLHAPRTREQLVLSPAAKRGHPRDEPGRQPGTLFDRNAVQYQGIACLATALALAGARWTGRRAGGGLRLTSHRHAEDRVRGVGGGAVFRRLPLVACIVAGSWMMKESTFFCHRQEREPWTTLHCLC